MSVRPLVLSTLAATLLLGAGCLSVRVEPIKVEVDVTLRVERQLEDIFAGLDEQAKELATDDGADAASPDDTSEGSEP